jgi:hypothetical protein
MEKASAHPRLYEDAVVTPALCRDGITYFYPLQ